MEVAEERVGCRFKLNIIDYEYVIEVHNMSNSEPNHMIQITFE
jgi:hypothetical protein